MNGPQEPWVYGVYGKNIDVEKNHKEGSQAKKESLIAC